jgi:hypothetical protein
MMPSVDCHVGRQTQRIAAILSTITLLTLAGCGGIGAGIEDAPPPIAEQNDLPVITGAPPTAVVPGQAYIFTPQASDANGDSLTFEIQNRPSWANFDSATGRLWGTPSAAAVGMYSNVVISATDGAARASLPAFSISVNTLAMGQAVLSWLPPTARTDGTPLTNLSGYRIYYGDSPAGLSNVIDLNTTGVTNHVVENLSAGTWYFAISAFDAAGLESAMTSPASKIIS